MLSPINLPEENPRRRHACPECKQSIESESTTKPFVAVQIRCPRYETSFFNACTDASSLAVICASVSAVLGLLSKRYKFAPEMELINSLFIAAAFITWFYAEGCWLMAAIWYVLEKSRIFAVGSYVLKKAGIDVPTDVPQLGAVRHPTDPPLLRYALDASSVAVVWFGLSIICCPSDLQAFGFSMVIGLSLMTVADCLWLATVFAVVRLLFRDCGCRK